MTADFVPQNALERQLVAAQNGEIPPEQFIETLLGSEVFMPIYERHAIGGLQSDQRAQPLKLVSDDGGEVLVLFTSPERAKAFVRDFPGYGGGLVTELTWIFEKLGIGFGISLNPDQTYGMDFEARDVAQLAGSSGAHGQA
ncbi:SseB family protein [Thiohalocapsa marina]|uniref:SseB family protein n=1 Tax=Thiohalocapsa marina TaxID=424902 RepID=A0A5M8FQ87_9GAMM|nr:SseB family protein [Thiohalocapsa marina]KAA6183042.1 SseB family protein [Thiohalocapsa marina]